MWVCPNCSVNVHGDNCQLCGLSEAQSRDKKVLASKEQRTNRAKTILVALGCYVAALLSLIPSSADSSGGFRTTSCWLIPLYALGGKWLVAGVFAIAGTIGLVLSFGGAANKDNGPRRRKM